MERTLIRARFTKLGKVRFLSHRDVARCWERALRRAELPVARTEGFSPRPKVSFGLALPTGGESLAEYLDVVLLAPVELEPLAARLSAALPVGIDVTAVGSLAPGADSLQHEVTSCDWELTLPGADAGSLAAAVERTLAATSVVAVLERKGVEVEHDLRPAILSLGLAAPADGTARLLPPRVSVELVNGAEAGGRSVRPGEVAQALVPGIASVRVHRTAQWIEREGRRREPLPAAPPAPMERAS